MVSARDFLIRGLLAGLVAGIVAFGVAYVVGEPSVNAAIALEESGFDRPHPWRGGRPFRHRDRSRGDRGPALPAVDGRAAHRHRRRRGHPRRPGRGAERSGPRAGSAACGAGPRPCWSPPSASPPSTCCPSSPIRPNPPAVGSGDTIGVRTGLYFTMVAISVVAAVAAVIVGRKLAVGWGGWYAGLAAAAGYLVVTLVAVALLPNYNEVPADFPADGALPVPHGQLRHPAELVDRAGRRPWPSWSHRLSRKSAGLAEAKTAYADTSLVITAPSAHHRAEAEAHLAALAKPTGALGRLEPLAAWMASVQGVCPPRPLDRVRAVILAGDHGVSHARRLRLSPRGDGGHGARLRRRPGRGQRARPAAPGGAAGPATWASTTTSSTCRPRSPSTRSGGRPAGSTQPTLCRPRRHVVLSTPGRPSPRRRSPPAPTC